MPSRLALCALLLAGCGDRVLLQDATGRWRLAAEAANADELRAALAAAAAPAAVVAFEEVRPDLGTMPGARPRVLVVGDALPALPDGVDVLVVVETGAAVAVDCALLAGHGVALPERILCGPRLMTAANAATGPDRHPAPGDLAAAMLRRQHAERFAAGPAGEVLPIAFVQQEGVWHDRVRAEVEAAVANVAGVRLQHRSTVAPELLPAMVRQARLGGVRAVLVSADDWRELAAAVASARAQQVAVIALDRTGSAENVAGATIVGADQAAIGRALGGALQQLAPDGASIVDFGGDRQRPAHRLRREAFASALGLRVP